MRYFNLQYFIILFAIVFFSCNSNNTKEEAHEKISIMEDSFQFDIENTKVDWHVD